MTLTANLFGKTAFVTGAFSGLGGHFARVLARAGADVIVAARRLVALEALIAKLGRNACALQLDVANEASIRAASNAAGPVDILVNNAGVTVQAVRAQTAADFDYVINTNLRGAFVVATQIGRIMQTEAKGGSIITAAAIPRLRQGGHLATYAICKAGIIQMTKQRLWNWRGTASE